MSGNVAALSFRSYEDFEVCNEYMDIKLGDTATSSDGMFTVMIKTEITIPPGTLVVTTEAAYLSVSYLEEKYVCTIMLNDIAAASVKRF
jgi:hypothetical protein